MRLCKYCGSQKEANFSIYCNKCLEMFKTADPQFKRPSAIPGLVIVCAAAVIGAGMAVLFIALFS